MQIFDFSAHTPSVSYPQRGSVVQLGGSYSFATKPSGDPMRTLTLRFRMLRWVRDDNGVISSTLDPTINARRLELFYLAHELHEEFIYPHELYGNMVVRFAQPLNIPEAKLGGDGVVEDVTLTLIEQPT